MIIGITGTLGAGKTTVAEYLVSQGFTYRSVRSFIIEEVHRRNIPVNRDTLVSVGNEIRAAHGGDYIIKTLIAEVTVSGSDVVIESIRAIPEATLLLAEGGVLVAVDADVKVRYERIIETKSQVVPVSFQAFTEQEAREMHSSDTAKQSIADVMALATFSVVNSGSEVELHQEIDRILSSSRETN